MKCNRCLNEDTRLFFKGKCRRCLSGGHILEKDSIPIVSEMNSFIHLTPYQKEVSDYLLGVKGDVFVEAVCGAGKTEICLEKIKEVLKEGLVVGWTIPRREVVLELSTRLQLYFPELRVVPVCEGYTDICDGDIIVCTTHQLFRYYQYFDLLIVDEPDAFPFANNTYLNDLLKVSCKGQFIYLSATTDDFLESKVKVGINHVYLAIRPSLKAMPEPIVKQSVLWSLSLIHDLYKHKNEKNLIFCPTIKLAKIVSIGLNCNLITSKTENKEDVLVEFRNSSHGFLVCTSILERGVTFSNINVFVLYCDHQVWNTSSLIQIAGRVGRGMNPEKRYCYFYSVEITEGMIKCLSSLKKANQLASYALTQ